MPYLGRCPTTSCGSGHPFGQRRPPHVDPPAPIAFVVKTYRLAEQPTQHLDLTVQVRRRRQGPKTAIARVVTDLSAFGGAKSTALQDKGPGANAQQKVWGGAVETTGLAAGTQLVPVRVTDKSAAKVTQVVPVYIFAGSLLEVGQGKPLATVKDAVAAAVAGDAIVLGDGTYRGVSNKNAALGGKNIVIVGNNGPTAVTIDCGGSQRFFSLNNSGENLAATIAGVTIKNCAFGALRNRLVSGVRRW